MNGYRIVVEALILNELDKSIILKKAGKRIWKNIRRDPIAISMLAIPIPSGGAITVANITQHMARNKGSRRAAALVARKYGISPSSVIKKMAKVKAARQPSELAKGLYRTGAIS